jgi:hypothetical protein
MTEPRIVAIRRDGKENSLFRLAVAWRSLATRRRFQLKRRFVDDYLGR